ncbi:MAG: glycosyltransferase family 2 protein [Gemmatimonadetes bacterium]|nr:glycosyltransferase family 2 protein [Gemmatimonadota bacterium]
MRLSVVVTTYNHPEWLEKVLWGFSAQTFRDFELLVADDGSDAPTRELIERIAPGLGYPVRHIWHPKQGFRKCTILNAAIAASAGEYLFFTDGDCIPRPDLLAVHAALAERGRFLSGGYLKLPMGTSQAITREDILAGRSTDYAWLRAHGTPRSAQALRLCWGSFMARALDSTTTTRPSFNGHNASAWRDDLVRVNGFDERLEWGGLDREIGERLENAGVKGKQIRHRALVVHLDHGRGYKRPEAIARNRAIRDEVAAKRLARTPAGLDRHLSVQGGGAA